MMEQPPPFPVEPWLFRCWAFTIILFVAMMAHGFLCLLVVPKFEKIFEDMLGSREHLPLLTQVIIGWSHFLQHGFLFLLPLVPVPFVMLWRTHGSSMVCSFVAAMTALLFLSVPVCVLALFLPLIGMIQSV